MKKMKKMKLLTAVGGTAIIASAALTVTACSTATSPAIDATVTIVGPDNVNVKCGEEKTIDYTALVKPITYSQDVTWTSTPIPEEYEDCVVFDNGKLSISDVEQMGSFDFTITASSRIDPTKTNTEKVTVNVVNADVERVEVNSVTVLGPENTYEADAGKEGTLTFVAKAYPENASQQFEWSKGPEFDDEKIKNKIHFTGSDNGIVSWDDDLEPNKDEDGNIIPYQLTFTARSLVNTSKEATFTLNLLIQPAKVTSVVIDGPQTIIKTTSDGITDIDYKAKVEPSKLISQEVTWSLENGEGSPITEVASINPTSGELTYTPLSPRTPNTYKGTIIATPKDHEEGGVVGRLDIEIDVNEVKPTDISVTNFSDDPIKIPITVGTAGSYKDAFSATVQPVGEILKAATDVTWNHSSLPEGVSFKDNANEATISWTGKTKPGTYEVNIWANCKNAPYRDVCSKQQKIIFDITRPDPTSITIAGEKPIKIVEQTKVIKNYTATVSPTDADQSVTWSISDYGKLSKDEISIDEKTGALSLDIQAQGKYSITIHAVSNVKSDVTEDYQVGLEVTDTEPQDIVINGPSEIKTDHGKGGSQSYTATVLPESTEQSYTWSCGELPKGVEFKNGILAYDENVESGTHLITITATSTVEKSITKDFNVSLIVSKETPTGIEITGNENPIEIYSNENKTLQLSATVKPSQAEQKVRWSIDETFSQPEGVTVDPNSGLVSTGNKLIYKEDETSSHIAYTEYTFKVLANSVEIPKVESNAIVTVHVLRPAPISVNINGEDEINIQNGVRPEALYAAYTANVAPTQASQEVEWTATWEGGSEPSGISFDTTRGYLTYCEPESKVTAPPGTYTLYLTATSKENSQIRSEVKAVKINVASAFIDSIKITCQQYSTGNVTATMGVGGSTQLSASVSPETAPQSLRWSVATETYGKQVTVDQNGLVSWNFNEASSGTPFDVVINASSTEQVADPGTFTFHFTVNHATPTTVSIEGSSNITLPYGSEAAEFSYSAKVFPSTASQEVTWTAISDLPKGLEWDNTTGTLKYDGTTPVGSYPITLEASAKAKADVKGTFQVVVNITTPESESIAINGDSVINVDSSGTSSVEKYYTAIVSPEGASQEVTWSATGTDKGVEFDTSTGKLTIDPTQTTEKQYTVELTASQGTLKPATLTVTINIYSDPGELTLNTLSSVFADDCYLVKGTTGWDSGEWFKLTNSDGQDYTDHVWYNIEPTGSTTTLPSSLHIRESDSNPGYGTFAFNCAELGKSTFQFKVTATPQDATKRAVSQIFTCKFKNNVTFGNTTYNLQEGIDPNTFQTHDGSGYKTQTITYIDNSTEQITFKEGYTDITGLEIRSPSTQTTQINDHFLYGVYGVQKLILNGDGFKSYTTIGDYFLSHLNPQPTLSDFQQLDFRSFSGLQTIGSYFLYDNHNLNTLILPDKWAVSSIGDHFMDNATAMTQSKVDTGKLILPTTTASSMTIGTYFMFDCWDLTQVNLGNIMLSYFPAVSDDDKYTFASDKKTDTGPKCIIIGITIDGDDAANILGRFGESTANPWRNTKSGSVPRS